MAANLHEQERITPDQTTTQIKPSSLPAPKQTTIFPTCSRSENSWSLVPKPALPVRMCTRLTSRLLLQKCHVENLSSMTSPTSFQPAPVIPVLQTALRFSSTKSIPVSVVKRVRTDRNATYFNAALTYGSEFVMQSNLHQT